MRLIAKEYLKKGGKLIAKATNILNKQNFDIRLVFSRSLLQKFIAITSNPGPAAKGANLGVLFRSKRTSVPFLRRVLLQVRKIEWSVPLK